jgi:putative flippase GtrA
VLTYSGAGHKLAMTLIYCVGILQTFLLNRRWTFSHQGCYRTALVRYLIIYLLGYLVFFGGLYVFVDLLGYPHQWVQAILIIFVALLLFSMLRVWIFEQRIEAPGNIQNQGDL